MKRQPVMDGYLDLATSLRGFLFLGLLGLAACDHDAEVNDQIMKLTDVTMLEAVEALRDRHLYLHFERESLDEGNTDYSRPVVDSLRRFDVTLSWGMSPEQMLDAVTRADGHYQWESLKAADMPVYWIFPRSSDDDLYGRSKLVWHVQGLDPKAAPLSELVMHQLGLSEHHIQVFDRAGYLTRAGEVEVGEVNDQPAYMALTQLFAHSAQRLTWTLGGVGSERVLSIGSLPD
jgi:hypothetical protein